MAIAFVGAADGGNNTGGTNNLSFAYTTGAGSNLLVVAIAGDVVNDDITGVTYNSVSMTLGQKQARVGADNRWTYWYFLLAPATGTNNVVISAGSTHYLLAGAADYSGAKQSAQPDAMALNNSGAPATTLTSSITTVADNSWAILLENGFGGVTSNGTGAVRRATDGVYASWSIFDSNGPITPAGSYSMTTNRSIASNTIQHNIISFSPSGLAVPDTAGSPIYRVRQPGWQW